MTLRALVKPAQFQEDVRAGFISLRQVDGPDVNHPLCWQAVRHTVPCCQDGHTSAEAATDHWAERMR